MELMNGFGYEAPAPQPKALPKASNAAGRIGCRERFVIKASL